MTSDTLMTKLFMQHKKMAKLLNESNRVIQTQQSQIETLLDFIKQQHPDIDLEEKFHFNPTGKTVTTLFR